MTSSPPEITPAHNNDAGKKWRSRLVLLIALILATAPPMLVYLDRWLGILSPGFPASEKRQPDPFAMVFLPDYFPAILACTAALLIFMFFQRRDPLVVVENAIALLEYGPVSPRQAQTGLRFIIAAAWGFALVVLYSLAGRRLPGWDLALVWLAWLVGWFLRSLPLGWLWEGLKKRGELWIAIFLAHLSLVAALASYFGQRQYFPAMLALLAAALCNLWRFRREIPLIYWIISLALVLYALDIDAWWFAVLGDEYYFHEMAWKLASQTGFVELGQTLFRADGIFGTHPYFSSLLQAVPMMFWGTENFGWRFSTLYLSALGVGFFYLFARTFLERRAALVAAFFLAVSHYIMSFGKIGYNNLQALFALNLALAVSAWALRARHALSFACLGSALALCFYLFPASLYVVPLPVLLLLLYYPPVSRQAAGRWLVMLAAGAALLFPLLLQPLYWQRKVAGTLFNRPELFQSSAAALGHIATNLVYSFFSFLYIPVETHFVSSSYVDPLTGGLVLIGMCVFAYQLRRQRFALFVALGFGMFLLLVGASHDYINPPNTRMFLLLPWFALFAAWGLIWLGEHLRRAGVPRIFSSLVLMPLLLVAVTGLNLYQAYELSYLRYADENQIESLFVRISENVYRVEPRSPKNYVVLVDENWDIGGLLEFQKVYPHLAWAQLYQIRLSGPVLPPSSLPLLTERDTIVILAPRLPADWQAALDEPLRETGKKPCAIYTPGGQKRFMLYHAPNLPQACLAP